MASADDLNQQIDRHKRELEELATRAYEVLTDNPVPELPTVSTTTSELIHLVGNWISSINWLQDSLSEIHDEILNCEEQIESLEKEAEDAELQEFYADDDGDW